MIAQDVRTEVGPPWQRAVLSELSRRLGDTSKPSVTNCEGLARLAQTLLGGQSLTPKPTGFLTWLFGADGAPQDVASAITQSLNLAPEDSPIATARAMQSIGIALCRANGIPLADCPCFADLAGLEWLKVLTLVIRLAAGDWTGLVIPFHPLT